MNSKAVNIANKYSKAFSSFCELVLIFLLFLYLLLPLELFFAVLLFSLLVLAV